MGGEYYNFNPELPEPFNRIHPFQVKAVRKLVENGFPEDIEFVLLFGGSLDLSCGKYSDLDLYVITNNPERDKVYSIMHSECLKLGKRFDILISNLPDFLEALSEHGTVESRIKEKGVCIYAKKKSYADRQSEG